MERKLEAVKSRVSGQSSFREESQSNDGQEEVGNKRKVLNDIVAMLNQKYNKNIKLDWLTGWVDQIRAINIVIVYKYRSKSTYKNSERKIDVRSPLFSQLLNQ